MIGRFLTTFQPSRAALKILRGKRVNSCRFLVALPIHSFRIMDSKLTKQNGFDFKIRSKVSERSRLTSRLFELFCFLLLRLTTFVKTLQKIRSPIICTASWKFVRILYFQQCQLVLTCALYPVWTFCLFNKESFSLG